MIDHDTIALDAELSVENQLRAQLAAAVADNKALVQELDNARRIAQKWRTRATTRWKENR